MQNYYNPTSGNITTYVTKAFRALAPAKMVRFIGCPAASVARAQRASL
ncbi:MAG TPA: hypothetical protein PKN75_13790 [Bacteroidia bacterium]|nr:hypothetical protein [Bacteroidia bacterium]HNU34654.1 hypothetical protein [Bacteroidia bacterium]